MNDSHLANSFVRCGLVAGGVVGGTARARLGRVDICTQNRLVSQAKMSTLPSNDFGFRTNVSGTIVLVIVLRDGLVVNN